MYMTILLALLAALLSVSLADPARVLIACVASRPRITSLGLLAKELQEVSGMEVTLAVPGEAAAWPEVNSTSEARVMVAGGGGRASRGGGGGGGGGADGDESSAYDRTVRRLSQMAGTWDYAEHVHDEVSRSQHMYGPLVEAFADDKPDLMIIDSHTFAAFDVAHTLGVPYIVHHGGLLDAPTFARAYVPAHGTGYSINMRPWERCMNFVVPYLHSLALQPSLRQLNGFRASRDLPPVDGHFQLWDESLFVASTAFGLEYARPLSPTTELIGPIEQPGVAPAPCGAEPEPEVDGLDDDATEADVMAWLNGVNDDVLLVSGLASLTTAQLVPLADALERSRKPVLWVGDAARRLEYGRAPKFRKFAARDGCYARFLDHSAISMVLAHCDLHEVHSTVLAGKPTVCLPATSQQLDVATRLADAGAGMTLPIYAGSGAGADTGSDVDGSAAQSAQSAQVAAALKSAIHDATQHSSHQRMSRGVRYLAATMTRAGGVKRAAHLVDSVIALGGTAHMRPLHLAMPWYSAMCLDVYCAGAATAVALFVACRLLLAAYSLLLRVC